MFTDEDNYRDPCGCVWKDGQKIKLCPRHKHKDVNTYPFYQRRQYMC